MTIDLDDAFARIIESEDKVKYSCLTDATFTNNGNKFIGFDIKIQMIENIIGLIDISKGNIFKSDISFDFRQFSSAFNNWGGREHHGGDFLDIDEIILKWAVHRAKEEERA